MEKVIGGNTFVFKDNLTVGDLISMNKLKDVKESEGIGEAEFFIKALSICILSINGNSNKDDFEGIIYSTPDGIIVLPELAEIASDFILSISEKKTK